MKLMLSVLLVLGLAVPGRSSTDPVDIIVYSDHVPPNDRSGAHLDNPFNDTQDGVTTGTRLLIKPVPGFVQQPATMDWSTATWAKYVFISDFTEAANAGVSHIQGQRIGVFNTETKAFCELVVDPVANASVARVAVANPQADHTRIYYEGVSGLLSGGQPGSPFGYVDANLATDPCAGNWPIVKYTVDDLVAATPAQVPPPCQNNYCGWDDMALLRHDDTTDVLAFNNWLQDRIVVVSVASSSPPPPTRAALMVPAVYFMPQWKPPTALTSTGRQMCFVLRPVKAIAVDPTRVNNPDDANDLRFTSVFDVGCTQPYREGNSDHCAPWEGTCPTTGQPCTLGDDCRACAFSGDPCTVDSDCSGACTGSDAPCMVDGDCDVGETCFHVSCLRACANASHPAQLCSNTGERCVTTSDCPPTNTFFPNTCVCTGQGRFGKPAQEFSFNPTTGALQPTSALFQGNADPQNDQALMNSPGFYDSLGNLWLTEQYVPVIYNKRQSDGEHAYFTKSNPGGAEAHPPDATLGYEGAGLFNQVTSAVQVDSFVYYGTSILQRALYVNGQWSKQDFRFSTGVDLLPSESPIPEIATALHFKWHISAGGSPWSLWMTPTFGDGNASGQPKDRYLMRVPAPHALSDGFSTVRPSIAWSGKRLWLVAEHNGALQYRVRDDGRWSGWFPLPAIPSNGQGALVGAGVIANANKVQVYVPGRGTGSMYWIQLTSPLTCTPGANPGGCTWSSSWMPLPTGVATSYEPAATFASGIPVIAVRDNGGKVWYTYQVFGSWAGWIKLTGLTTDIAPGLTYQATQSRLWVAARDQTSQKMNVMNVALGGDSGLWVEVSAGIPAGGWGTGPVLVTNGGFVRMFASGATFPNWTYQTIYDGSAWGNWRVISSRGPSTVGPAAASVNGEVNVMSQFFVSPMAEQAVE